jgi:hypothetical protein
MTIRAGYFGKTQSFAVTDTADDFQVEGAAESRHVFLVQSDKTVHVAREGNTAAVADSLRIPANTPVLVAAFAGEHVSFILGTGETDGTIWFTEVDH